MLFLTQCVRISPTSRRILVVHCYASLLPRYFIMKLQNIFNIILFASWTYGAEHTQTQSFSPQASASGSGSLVVVGQQGIVKSGFMPFDARMGTLHSFKISWDANFSSSGVVGASASGSLNPSIGGNFAMNSVSYDGTGGGSGAGGNPGDTIGPINIPIAKSKVFSVAEAGRSYDPVMLSTVTGNSSFSLLWSNSVPLATVSHSNMASVLSSLSGTVSITYDYTPTKYRSVGTFTGSGTSGSTDASGTSASFNGPWGISADALGNLYHLDYTGKRIRRTTPSGAVSFIDSFTSFPPIASAIDPATGHLYVAIETHRILRYVNKNAANYPKQDPVYGPETDFPDSTIVYAGTNGTGTTDATGSNARFNAPHGLFVRDGILYVADKGNNRIRKINLSNAAVTTVTVTGGTLSGPEGLWVMADGTIYVASTGSHLVQKISTNGTLSTVAGSASGNLDGVGTAARFNAPRGLALNDRGEIFVADSGNHAIRRISPDGTVITVAGGSASGAFADGSGASARFNSPRGVTFGSDGLLYVTDFGNHRTRWVNATQPRIITAVDSLAGLTTARGSVGPSRTLAVSAEALEGTVTVTAPAGYEVALGEGSYAASLTINPEDLPATLRLRLAADAAAGNAAGNLVLTSAGADDVVLSLSGRVLDITPSLASMDGFSSVSGTSSTSKSFEFSGNTGENYIITAPPGYEVSLDGVDFATSKTFAGVSRIFSTALAMAALKTDGSVVTWGSNGYGGDSSAVASRLSSGVSTITATSQAFAALKTDGSVVTWGHVAYGGNSAAVASSLSSGVIAVYSTLDSFAALKNDGSVVTWGWSGGSGGGDSSAVASQLLSGVVDIFPTYYAFAALKSDGFVITWGYVTSGGDSSAVAGQLSSGVSSVVPGAFSFAAIKQNGSVVTWGRADHGGDSSAVASQLASGVVSVFNNGSAWAALKNDGSVVTWGNSQYGGNSSAVASSLVSGVSSIHGTDYALAALKTDGSVVSWGDSRWGGDTSAVASSLASGVISIQPNVGSFAALKSDGSVVTWGAAASGGDSSAVAASLAGGVSSLHAHPDGEAFAALLDYGSVVTWGGSQSGGDSSTVANRLASNVASIHASRYAFVAIKDNGTVVPWAGSFFNLTGSSLPATLPTTSPTVHVRLAADATPGAVSGTITITSASVTRGVSLSGNMDGGLTPLQSWRQQHFGSSENSGASADLATPDGDGVANLVKYALNIDPGQSAVSLLPAPLLTEENGGRYLAVSVKRNPSRNDVNIHVEVSDDLNNWTVIGSSVNGTAFQGNGRATEMQNPDGSVQCLVRDNVPMGTASKRFIRVRVTGP